MEASDRQISGIVYSIEFHGVGSPASNDGVIGLSADGGPADVATIYLTGPGTNSIHTVTIEQFLARVAAIYRSYCYRLPLTFTVRDGVSSLPLIMQMNQPI